MKYPFKYKAKVTYEIIDESLKTSVEITNLGEEVMPFNIGGHPAFNCPLYDNETFEDYKVVFEKPETFGSPLVVEGGLLDFDKPVYAQNFYLFVVIIGAWLLLCIRITNFLSFHQMNLMKNDI